MSADDLRAALPMPRAVEAAAAAFRAQGSDELVCPRRSALGVEPAGGTTLVMPSHLPGAGVAVKVVSVFPGNGAGGKPPITGLVTLLDETTGEPVALMDGTFLTAWRTGAACGAATAALAPDAVPTAAVLGCGPVGEAQVQALAAVRTPREIRVRSRDPERARELAERLGPAVAGELRAVGAPEEAVAGAVVVCTATPATEPLFAAGALAPGAHVNAVGSFTHAMGELDPTLIRDGRVFVDDRGAAAEEAGELERARRRGWTDPGRWTELGAVLRGEAPGRRGEETTVFKSVGLAVQDLTAAAAALEAARRLRLGRRVILGSPTRT